MDLRKFVACTVCVVTTAIVSAGCAEGTGQALTPTLPSADITSSNADGTKLKAGVPQPMSPRSATRVSNLTPQLVLQNAEGTFDPSIALSYVFEVFEGPTLIVKSDPISAGSPQTIFNVPSGVLKLNATYGWRAYAVYPGLQGSLVEGSISDGVSFRTPLPPPPVNPNTPGPIFCGGDGGRDIIACVSAAFPTRLVKTNTGDFSDERRFTNMEFLRDVIIATGKCKGLNLGRNRKRGGAEISRDFIVYRSNTGKDGRDRGVDIASGYDDTKTTLKLTWQLFDKDRNWGHPFYENYGNVDCSGLS